MARSSTQGPKPANLTLEQKRAAILKLNRRISELEGFDLKSIQNAYDPNTRSLHIKVAQTLQELLGHDSIEYRRYSVDSLNNNSNVIGLDAWSIEEIRKGYKEGIDRCLSRLRTLRDYFEESIADSEGQLEAISSDSQPIVPSRRVFVVHGHDNGVKDTVARYLTKLDLEPIILHEAPNQGRTILEKFEAYSNVAFAIVLFTPDDEGYPAGRSNEMKSRARQNVVLELGFFMGKLGRQRVCVLYKGDIELPSDYSGVLYIPFDNGGGWHIKLAQEIKASGINIDMNKAF